MFFKKKQDNSEHPLNDSAHETAKVLHDKPLVCLFDLAPEVLKSFAEESYNCTEATIGNLVRVPNNQRRSEHLLRLNYSVPANLHEFDVLVFDMGQDIEKDFDESDIDLGKVTGDKAHALLSQFPEKIFNPKPLRVSGILCKRGFSIAATSGLRTG